MTTIKCKTSGSKHTDKSGNIFYQEEVYTLQKKGSYRLVVLSLAVCIILFTTGCAGLMAHAISVRGSETKYRELKPSLSSPEPGKGRLFVYLTAGGVLGSAMYGGIWELPCTIDDAVYNLAGGAYCYADLTEGSHVFTIAKSNWNRRKFYRGEKKAEFSLKSGDEVYIMVDMTYAGAFSTFTPIVKDRETAEKEIADLPLVRNFETKFKVANE